MRHIAVLAVLFASALPLSAADRARTSAIPVTIDAHGGIVVEVRVNEAGPYRFLLDTGTSRSIVSDVLARQLAAPTVAKSDVVTNAGSEVRLVVRLTSLAVASARVNDVLAPVLPESDLAQIGPGVRGVLGQDFLSAFNYTLDYRHARVTWDEPLSCERPGAVPMIAAEGRFVMALAGDAGSVLRLVPDSGADAPVWFGTGRKAPRTVRVGGVKLDHLEAYRVERADDHADGLLPLHHFGAVSFAAGGACLVARK